MIVTASLHRLLRTGRATAATPRLRTDGDDRSQEAGPPPTPQAQAGRRAPPALVRAATRPAAPQGRLLVVSAGPGRHTRKAATAAPARSAGAAGCPFPGPGGAREPPSTRP